MGKSSISRPHDKEPVRESGGEKESVVEVATETRWLVCYPRYVETVKQQRERLAKNIAMEHVIYTAVKLRRRDGEV